MNRHVSSLRPERWWLRGRTGLAAILAVVLATAGILVSTAISGAVLTGSSFEGNDGNLAVNTTGNADWNSLSYQTASATNPYPNPTFTNDMPSGSGDNAFGQGSKEDIDCPTQVFGSIPPNKSDLTRFFTYAENTTSNTFLNLAWERANVLGNANMDFEFNQGSSACSNGPMVARTGGDILVTFDFGGSGTPTIGLLRWVTSATAPIITGFSTNACFSANAFPCWGDRKDMTNAGLAQAAVNTTTVSDTVSTPTVSLAAGEFGEASINLTGAGVFPTTSCETFGKASLNSRSSSSFTSEIKDFISPTPVHVTNCGTLQFRKQTSNGYDTFSYTTTNTSSSGGGLFDTATPTANSITSPDTQTRTTSSTANPSAYYTYQVLPGTYTVVEAAKTGWNLTDISCSSSGGNSGTRNVSTSTASVTAVAGGSTSCTFTNLTKLTPTITTALHATTINAGASTYDTASFTSTSLGTAVPTGTVTYTVYSDNACGTAGGSAVGDGGTKNIGSTGTIPQSDAVTFSTAGTYYWVAYYNAGSDANYSSTHSGCADEPLLVKANPSVTTQLTDPTSAGAFALGDQVTDSAALSNATSDAGQSITFYYTYWDQVNGTDPLCTGGTAIGSVTVSGNGTSYGPSTAVTLANAGIYHFWAVYAGDINNNSATSTCGTEDLTVGKASPSPSTAQRLVPNDSFTLANFYGSPSGTVTFSLYDATNATCLASGAAPVYTETMDLSSGEVSGTSVTVKTHNTGTGTGMFTATGAGTWNWIVSYGGNANNSSTGSACGAEHFTIVQ